MQFCVLHHPIAKAVALPFWRGCYTYCTRRQYRRNMNISAESTIRSNLTAARNGPSNSTCYCRFRFVSTVAFLVLALCIRCCATTSVNARQWEVRRRTEAQTVQPREATHWEGTQGLSWMLWEIQAPPGRAIEACTELHCRNGRQQAQFRELSDHYPTFFLPAKNARPRHHAK